MVTVQKKRNWETGTRYLCCWADCDRDGVELHKVILHEHRGPCEYADPTGHPVMVFCSERHKMYHVNSHRDLNNLPAGYRKAF